MPRFTLRGDGPLKYDGLTYEPGDSVGMTEAEAAAKLASGRLVPAEPESSPAAPHPEPTDDGAGTDPPPGSGTGGTGDDVYGKVYGENRPAGTARPAADAVLMADLAGAIALLPPGSPDHFNGGGKGPPSVEAIEALVRYDLSAAERDAAWALVQSGF